MAADTPDADIVGQLRELRHPEDLLFPDPMIFSKQVADLSVEVAVYWTNGVTDYICSYANDSPTAQGGMHVAGFSTALADVVRTYASSSTLIDSTTDSLLGGDIREGLAAIVKIHCDDPRFEPIHDDGINGRRLSTLRMREFVYWATSKHLSSWLDEHPTEATLIVNKSISAAHDRVLARGQTGRQEHNFFKLQTFSDFHRHLASANPTAALVESDRTSVRRDDVQNRPKVPGESILSRRVEEETSETLSA